MWQETLSIEGPYNFTRVLDRLSLDPLHTVDKQSQAVKVPLFINSQPVVTTVTSTGTIENPSFVIEGSEAEELAIARLREIFQWDISLHAVNEHFQQTEISGLFQEHLGTPLILDFDLFGCLLKCIIHQQLNLKFAFTLTERFVKTFGFEMDGAWFYPRPETVAVLTVEQLRELQFSTRKAEYVIGIAQATVNGDLDFEKMKRQDDAEIMEQLIKLRGVGPWTVQNFLLFGLGRPNLFPTSDIGIQNALKKWYKLENKPTLAEMESFIKGWEPYLSYASLYLWRSIE